MLWPLDENPNHVLAVLIRRIHSPVILPARLSTAAIPVAIRESLSLIVHY